MDLSSPTPNARLVHVEIVNAMMGDLSRHPDWYCPQLYVSVSLGLLGQLGHFT